MWNRPRFIAAAALLLIVGSGYGGSRVVAIAEKQKPVQAAAVDARSEDRAAVRAAMQAFVKAFESRDAKALAARWTTGGEFRNVKGVEVKGRDTLQKGFTAFFAKTPEVTAELQSESLRFLSRDAAIDEGSVTIRRGAAEPATKARYRALLVREDGHWLMASLSESPDDGESIADLAWLIGEWKSQSGQGAEIHTTYSWSPSKKFIHVQFTLKEKERSLTGSQVIGVDPATGKLHTWTFETDGGVAEADWNRDGDHWMLDAEGTLANGATLTETNILRKVNNDTFTWQSVDRYLDDAKLADLPPVKVTRVTTAK